MKKIMLILGLSLTLQGCFFVAGAAAGAAAVAVVYDHRTLAKIMEDQDITKNAAAKIKAVPALHQDSHIEVTTFNQIVLLTGQTPKAEWRQEAEALVQTVPGVKRIYNQISIEGPTSSLIRTSDSWVTTKIKTEMLATKNLKSSSIKVVTENGVVYLMGVVSREQAEIAVNIARQASGVQRVIRIFQYTN